MRFSLTVFMAAVILILPFNSVHAAAVIPVDSQVCPSGSIVGAPPIGQIPTYDYDDQGILQFHFRFTSGGWNYNTLRVSSYNEGCVWDSDQNRGQAGGVILPDAKNLLVKVAPSEPGKFNLKVYDEDTGEFQGAGLGFVPNDFNSWGISLTLSSVTGSFNSPVVDTVTTPVVPLQQPELPPARNPVLIIPGVMGTELFNNDTLLWPNINQMLTDIGDNFLDDMAFNDDLTPINGDVSAGDLVKEPFPGEHYYDNLINALKQAGYTENQDLFVFPYDWRFGVSDGIVSELAARIKALAGKYKIDVIAHSTGGLLLKKVIQNQGGQYIDKAVMVGVPNYGSANADKILRDGDDLGIPWLSGSEIKNIAQNMPIIYDLLPSSELAKQPDFSVNAQAWSHAESLHTDDFDNYDIATAGINKYTLAGCGTGTLGDNGNVVSGDGTVSVTSAVANGDLSSTYFLLNSNHSKLPGLPGATELITDILSGSIPVSFNSDSVTQDPGKCQLHGGLGSLFATISNSLAPAESSPDANPSGSSSSSSGFGSSSAAAITPISFIHGVAPTPLNTTLVEKILAHPEHTLISVGSTIYLVEQGQKRGFKTLGEFLSYGYNLTDVVAANIADLDLPEGLLMTAKPGVLAKDIVTNKLYYLNSGLEKEWISTKAAIKKWTRNFPQVFAINLNGYRVGKTIKK